MSIWQIMNIHWLKDNVSKTSFKIIGALNKSDTAEVRVTTNIFKGRSVIDIRVWYIPAGAQELVPSRKGVTIDCKKVGELVKILHDAI